MLVDSSEHVDREAAVRAGIGFYGKNTLVIAPRLGLLDVLGTLVSSTRDRGGRRRSSATAAPAGSVSMPARPARWSSPAFSMRASASPTGRKPARRSRSRSASKLGATVYGCDICQQVCPWNRGVEKRRSGAATPAGAARLARSLAGERRDERAARALRAPLHPAPRSALPAPERARGARRRAARASTSRCSSATQARATSCWPSTPAGRAEVERAPRASRRAVLALAQHARPAPAPAPPPAGAGRRARAPRPRRGWRGSLRPATPDCRPPSRPERLRRSARWPRLARGASGRRWASTRSAPAARRGARSARNRRGLEALAGESRPAHAIEAEAALAAGRAIPGVHVPVGAACARVRRARSGASTAARRPPSGTRARPARAAGCPRRGGRSDPPPPSLN